MDQELKTLISLLDDTDIAVHEAVNNALLQKGLGVIPELETAWERSLNPVMQERIESLIHYIQFNHTKKNLSDWIKSGAQKLIEGASCIVQLQYPGFSLKKLDEEIEKISRDVYLSAGNHLTAIEKVKLLNYVFFELNNFMRNTTNYYSPQNSFINNVLETRKGTQLSLGIIYLMVANKVGLPIYGVNLPKSFILAYVNEFRHSHDRDPANDILFYINPYSKGAILNRRDIDVFIEQQNVKIRSKYYLPCDNIAIIKRLVMNLIVSYEKMGFSDRIKPLNMLLDEFKSYTDIE